MHRIVPESLEDLSCEGDQACHIQVKSRQERVGDFTLGQVARFLLDLFDHHVQRTQAGALGQPILVLERPVAGHLLDLWGQPIAGLPADHDLRAALHQLAKAQRRDKDEIERMCKVLSVYVLPWHAAAVETRDAVSARHDLLPAAAEPGVLALRDAIAECVDANAAAGWDSRAGLDRTRLNHIVTDAAALVDRNSLEEAIHTGAVEPVDFDRPLHAPAFYEGVDVQPGHIAAGLPAPRPATTGQVVEAIDRGKAVLVTGPSGVGKSTVMWAAAYSTRHILWYRVRRLRDEDVNSVVRLARALHPSLRSPVGFVVDGLGLGMTAAWDALQQHLAGDPGVVLLGSARTEDTLALRSLSACTTVAVSLDESVAEQIHNGLLTAGVTTVPHWREAYENAGGLTLEYTYLLTQGRRLADIITEQVKRRVLERRDLELKIIALVAVAHRWGADVPMRAVQRQVEASDADFRLALARLNDEHLVHVFGTHVAGLHQLRSKALADAVHAMPPPVLAETVDSVVQLLDDHQQQPFLAKALTEQAALDNAVVDRVVVELTRRRTPAAFVGALQALRIVDFHRRAADWARVLERCNVPPALRAITLQWAMLGMDLPPQVKPEVADAVAAITPDAREKASPLRDAVVSRLGSLMAAQILADCSNAVEAQRFLAVLVGIPTDISSEIALTVPGSRLSDVAVDLSADAVGDLLSSARLVSSELAHALSAALFDRSTIFDKLRAYAPWLTEASVIERDTEHVAYARLLHISDEAQPDFEHMTRSFARVMLRCLPECERIDMQALLPGGLPIRVGDHTFAAFGFGRHNDHPPTAVAWNRMRSQVAASAMSAMDPTTRAHTACVLVQEAAHYLDELTRVWCTARERTADRQSLNARQAALSRQASELTLPVDRAELFASSADKTAQSHHDSLHSLIEGLVDNLTPRLAAAAPRWSSLAGYVGGTLRECVAEVRELEQWGLVGQDSPVELERLDRLLIDLHATLAELAWGELLPQAIVREARSGDYKQALARVADHARSLSTRRAVTRRDVFVGAARRAGLSVHLVTRSPQSPDPVYWPAIETAVVIDLVELTQWPEILLTLQDLLPHDPATEGGRPAILIVPAVDDQPIPRMAHQLVSDKLWPDTGPGYASWADALPPPHLTPLTDAAVEAHEALRCLSGLAVFTSYREPHAHQESFAQQQAERYQRALRTIDTLQPADSVISEIVSYLTSTAQRVQAELDSGPSTDEHRYLFSVGVAHGATGTPTEDWSSLNALLAICLQWDVNPDAAARMLEQA
ncbi:hypothetical protein ABZX92_30820 [Lentzea sp. NPDC006480]|uniref:hypothetical protein n=1 Tax=Lentzea sp. NPDC006480 TaxID=3157176 RepID=UPI00339DFC5E